MDKIKDSFKKLSSREKTLIYILVILLIVCFGWLILLQPQLTLHTSLKSSKDSLELQLTELSNKFIFFNRRYQNTNYEC